MEEKQPMSKGTVLYNIKDGVRKEYGQEKIDEIIGKCSPEAQEILKGSILATEKYPEKVLAEFIRSCYETLGEEYCKNFIREMVKSEMKFVFKVLMKYFVSIEKFSENNPKLWDTLHDTGKLTVTKQTSNSHTIEITDFDFVDPYYEKGFMEYHCGMLELLGAKNVKCATKSGGKNKYIQTYVWEK